VLLATAHVATPITHFISFEVGNLTDWLRGFRLIPRVWYGAFVAVVGVVTVVYVALEVVRAMKPRPSANEDAASKPFRAVIAVRSAAIRSCLIVTVGAVGGGSNIDRDADLAFRFGSSYHQANSSNSD
jgi:hypothetical protein